MNHSRAATKDLVDVALSCSAILVIQWVLAPLSFHENTGWLVMVVGCTLLLLFHSTWFSRACVHHDPVSRHGIGSWRTGFVQTEHAGQSWRYYGGTTLAGLAGLVLGTWLFAPDRFAGISWTIIGLKIVSYLVSGFIQSVFVFDHLLPRCQGFLSRPAAVLLVAAFFALLHAPNAALMGICLLAGIVWGWEYARRPNLVPVILAQAVLGTYLRLILQLSFRVGPYYYHPNEFLIRRLMPWWQDLARRLF